MSLSIEIQKKPNKEIEEIKICSPREVFELKEVQEIKDAIQEHLLFIGLDRGNNVRNISLIGIGASNEIKLNSKYIIRTALVTASDRVILVHNHPSNNIKSSNVDNQITNVTKKLLKTFNIELIDHIIVTENDYSSMLETKVIKEDFENKKTKEMNMNFLIEENIALKNENKELKNKLQKCIIKDQEDEFE